MKKVTIHVADMACASCETRIEKALGKGDGVVSARASIKGGRVDIEYDDDKTSLEELKSIIRKNGYSVGADVRAIPAIALGIGIVLAASYMIANTAGVFNALPAIASTLGYGMLFIAGILTSVHCVAMCGGIALSQSVGKLGVDEAQPGQACAMPAPSTFKRFLPGLLYNAGRVVSYTVIGGVVGALGAAFSFSPLVKGIIAGAAGIFMVFLGLKMLGILSGLPRVSRLLPAPLKKAAGTVSAAIAKRGPFAIGVLNGFMPRGPLQTMQLYALGTGSLEAGALSMFIFSIGTVPLMLVFGLAATLLPRKLVPSMIKASSVLVILLGTMTLGRAAGLSGIALPELSPFRKGGSQASSAIPGIQAANAREPAKASLQNGVQSVLTDFRSSGYYMPFIVQAGVPVKWTIRVTADGLNGCNNPVTIPSYPGTIS
ncbi:MAG: sulfite exporter TauE/SafE family protein [Spirochaetes bacterium]|nr:sulfite exporter TauE/SafE family protein [Spirochaetota bacterium]